MRYDCITLPLHGLHPLLGFACNLDFSLNSRSQPVRLPAMHPFMHAMEKTGCESGVII